MVPCRGLVFSLPTICAAWGEQTFQRAAAVPAEALLLPQSIHTVIIRRFGVFIEEESILCNIALSVLVVSGGQNRAVASDADRMVTAARHDDHIPPG